MTKKTLLAALFAILAPALFSQPWFQTGDQWTYYVTTGWNGSNWGFHTLTVEGDTLIDNTLWKKITYRQITLPPEDFYVRAEGQQVYRLRTEGSPLSRVKIYDFSLVPGDTVQLSALQWYVVVDTSRLMVGHQQRRVQHFQWKGSGPIYAVVEGIGMTGLAQDPANPNACSFLLLDMPFCMGDVDGYSFYFRCFRRDENDLYWPFPNVCQTLNTANFDDEARLVRVWPNPARTQLWTRGNYKMLRLFDAQGRLVWENIALSGDLSEVPVGHLPRGIYFLSAYSEAGAVTVQRIVLVP